MLNIVPFGAVVFEKKIF